MTIERNGQTDMAAAYARDGYIVEPDLFDAAEVDALKAETAAICRGERGRIFGMEDVTPAPDGTDDALMAGVLAVHFPHKRSEPMLEAMSHPRIVDVLRTLIGPDVKSMQSMLFVKHAGKPGQPWHQDEFFIPTRDRSLLGCWIALDDATVDNGCLWVHPGSHRPGVLYPMAECHDGRFDHNDEAHGFPFEREGGVPVEMKAGSVLFFNGYLLHRSLPNTTVAGFRRALVYHYMSAQSLLPWSAGPQPTPRDDYRDIVMVAGEDPYPWKPIESLAKPFVRAESAAMLARMGERLAALKATRAAAPADAR